MTDDADTNKGVCGDEVQETVESQESLDRKVEQLAEAINRAVYTVAHTGAGISTAAGQYNSITMDVVLRCTCSSCACHDETTRHP